MLLKIQVDIVQVQVIEVGEFVYVWTKRGISDRKDIVQVLWWLEHFYLFVYKNKSWKAKEGNKTTKERGERGRERNHAPLY